MDRILVVDDDPNIVKFVGLNLTEAGYRAVTANDGRRALECLKETPCALAVVDYNTVKQCSFKIAVQYDNGFADGQKLLDIFLFHFCCQQNNTGTVGHRERLELFCVVLITIKITNLKIITGICDLCTDSFGHGSEERRVAIDHAVLFEDNKIDKSRGKGFAQRTL